MAVVIILSFALGCLTIGVAPQATPPPATVAGCNAQKDNQQIQFNNGLYWCRAGKTTPVACLSPDGSRIDIGASFWTSNAILECRQQSNVLNLVSVACLQNNRRLEADQTLNDGNYFYKCVRGAAGALTLNAVACVGDNNAQVANGGQVKRGSFVFTCNVNATAAATVGGARPTAAAPGPPAPASPSSQSLTPVGCSFNGKQYKLGDDMELSGAWYKCAKDANGLPTSLLTGCVVNNTKYEIGRNWTDEFFAFRCDKVNGFVMGNAYSCIERYPNGTVTEYAPGRRWLVGSSPYNRYVIQCSKEGVQLRRRGIACYYTTNEGQGVLDAGCMKKVGQIMIQCSQPGATPNVRIRITENPTAADEQRLQQTDHLKFCDSKPLQSIIN